jgi:hypothetical protein
MLRLHRSALLAAVSVFIVLSARTSLAYQNVGAGSSSVACNSYYQAALGYNYTTNGLEYCNGTAWTSLLSSGTSGGINLGTSATATNPSRSSDLTTGLFSSVAASVAIAVSGIQEMTINGTGVGIGSTSPNSALDISQMNTALSLPSGTSAQRPSGVNGMIRYSQTNSALEAYYGGAWNTLSASGGGSSVNLGTAAISTNPQRSGEAGTGFFSANSGQVSVAVSISGTGTDAADYASTGLNLPVATESYKINGVNAIWQDNTNFNTALGDTALSSHIAQSGGTTGQYVFAAGYQALNVNTTGFYNTAVGALALAANTTGQSNAAVGAYALTANTAGNYNTAVGGMYVLYNNTTGGGNTAVGFATLYANTTGYSNTALGNSALEFNTTGFSNTAVGQQALVSNTTGAQNTAVGLQALKTNTTGVNNTALGFQAGYDVTTGGHNLIIGDYATGGVGITSGSNNIMIGQDVRPASQTASNQMDIGNLIYATGLASGSTASTGNVGIGTTSPAHPLEVQTSSAGSYQPVAGFFAPNNTTAGNASQMRFGTSASSNNAAEWRFVYQGSGSTSNRIDFGWYGQVSPTLSYNASGNVGIGTTSPSVALDVSNATSGSNLPFLRVGNTAGGTGNTVGIYISPWSTRAGGDSTYIQAVDDGAYAANLLFGTATTGSASSTSTERMRITSTGIVGIGTTSPGVALELYNPTTTSARMLVKSSGGAGNTVGYEVMTYYGMASGTYVMYGATDDGASSERASIFVPNAANTGVAEALSILKSSGNVGIGTTSPSQTLEVNGTIRGDSVGGGVNAAVQAVAAYPAYAWDVSGQGTDQKWWDVVGIGTSLEFRMGNDANSAANVWMQANRGSGYTVSSIIFPAGTVGIGTSSPQATLDINGYTRLAKNSSQPVACSSANDGAVALTHVYTLCICNGGSSSWVQSKDGSTACSW